MTSGTWQKRPTLPRRKKPANGYRSTPTSPSCRNRKFLLAYAINNPPDSMTPSRLRWRWNPTCHPRYCPTYAPPSQGLKRTLPPPAGTWTQLTKSATPEGWWKIWQTRWRILGGCRSGCRGGGLQGSPGTATRWVTWHETAQCP